MSDFWTPTRGINNENGNENDDNEWTPIVYRQKKRGLENEFDKQATSGQQSISVLLPSFDDELDWMNMSEEEKLAILQLEAERAERDAERAKAWSQEVAQNPNYWKDTQVKKMKLFKIGRRTRSPKKRSVKKKIRTRSPKKRSVKIGRKSPKKRSVKIGRKNPKKRSVKKI